MIDYVNWDARLQRPVGHVEWSESNEESQASAMLDGAKTNQNEMKYMIDTVGIQ